MRNVLGRLQGAVGATVLEAVVEVGRFVHVDPKAVEWDLVMEHLNHVRPILSRFRVGEIWPHS